MGRGAWRVMDVEINNRIEYCRSTCPYAEISADVNEYKSLGGTCMVLVTVECTHSGVCRYEDEGKENHE